MNFIWDLNKEKKNIEKHGFGFRLAHKMFLDVDSVDFEDLRYNYGEERRIIYSIVDNVKLCMCYSYREDKKRIISLRKANKREWSKYYGKNS